MASVSARLVMSRTAAGSAAGDLRPGEVFVVAGLSGQAEDSLAEYGSHDLRRAALDGIRPRPQEREPHVAAPGTGPLGTPHLVVVRIEGPLHDEQLDAEPVDLLV